MKKKVLFFTVVLIFLESVLVSFNHIELARPVNTHYASLINAISFHESGHNDYAIGDLNLEDHAYGRLQIRKSCLNDVNNVFHLKIREKDLLGDSALSVFVFQKYIEIYANPKKLKKNPSFEDIARIWNGGPDGYKKSYTQSYWKKVKKQLAFVK